MTRPNPLAGTLAIVMALAAAPAARAQDPALYQATAIVTGTDMRQRPLGFARCLTEVLVKVSGSPRLRDDPAAAALAQHADTFVRDYTYVDPTAWRHHHDDQGTYDRSQDLTVRFDPARVDAALAQLGATVWHGPRPLLEPVILMRPIGHPAYLLSAEAPLGADMRTAIVLAASEVGIGVRFPSEADLAAWAVVPFGFPAPLGAPDPTRLRVTGSLAWDVRAMGWVGTWRTEAPAARDWGVSGVGYGEAFADMVRGAVTVARGDTPP